MRQLHLSDRPEIHHANFLLKQSLEAGIYVNQDKLESRINDLSQNINSHLKEMNELIRQGINEQRERQLTQEQARLLVNVASMKLSPNSTYDVVNILSVIFNVPIEYFGGRDNLKANDGVLKTVYKDYPLPYIKLLREYRSLKKSYDALAGKRGLKTYIRPSDKVSNHGDRLGCITPKVELADTGRYQLSEPAIGNLSDDVLDLLEAPEGYYIVSMDVRQQEPTIFFDGVLNCRDISNILKQSIDDKYLGITRACVTQTKLIQQINDYCAEKGLENITESDWVWNYLAKDYLGKIKCYKKNTPSVDFAYLNSKLLEHLVPSSEITPEMRKLYKTAILAGGYGASKGTLIALAGEEVGTSLYRLLSELPEAKDYMERASQYISQGGRRIYTLFGTVLTLDERDKNNKKRNTNDFLRLMMNYPTQGTGADMLKFCIVDFYRWVSSQGYTYEDMRLSFTKHDEIIIYIKKELIHHLEDIKSLMELQVEDWCPILVEAKYGECYTK